MKIAIVTGRNHQERAALLFRDGLRAHGIEPEMCQDEPPAADLVVMWAYKRRRVIGRANRGDFRLLVMEMAYLGDRSRWISLGYGGLNGRADFCNADAPGDRLARHFPGLLRPWRHDRGGYALIIGQAPGDASLAGLNVAKWANERAGILKGFGWDVRFRPHPLRGPEARVNCQYDSGTLAESLQGAAFVVTFNSNTGVDAVCAGVPTIALDRGSMAWDMASHDLTDQLVAPDRQRWAERLAYAQWLPDEIASGSAWDRIKMGMSAPSRRGTVAEITTECRQ